MIPIFRSLPSDRREPSWRGPDPLLALLVLLASVLLPGAAPASSSVLDVPHPSERQFGRLTFGLSGGFQSWTLSSLEEAIEHRSDLLAEDGFEFQEANFPPTYAYSVEIEMRFRGRWFLQAQADWLRVKWDDRYRATIALLDGAAARSPVSIRHGAEVRTHPLIFGGGLGREAFFREVRFTLVGNALVAPLETLDESEVVIGQNTAETLTSWRSTGLGWGFEVQGGFDWVPDADMTLFFETYVRTGTVTVEPDDGVPASSFVPSRRAIDLGGYGLRVGIRWI